MKNNNRKKGPSRWAFVYIPVAIIIYLVLMLGGTIAELSFCSSEGCQLAGSIMKITKEEMYCLGIVAMTALALLGWMLIKTKKEIFRVLFMGGLSLMIIAETIFLGYMLISSGGEICVICLGFYVLMIFNFLVASKITEMTQSESFYGLFRIFTFFAGITVMVAMMLIDFSSGTKEVKPLTEGYSLIASPTCKYCIEIKKDLGDKNISYVTLDVKEYLDIVKFTGGETIPVLILKKDDQVTIFNSFNSIKKHLKTVMIKEGEIGKIIGESFTSTSSIAPTSLTGLDIINDGPAGCSMNVAHVEEEPCD